MDPVRLKPAVVLPVRRGRPLAAGVALALLFAFGAQNYVSSMRRCPYATRRSMPPISSISPNWNVRLDLASEPSSATVVRERDGRTMCVTPCSVGVPAESGVMMFRFVLPGHASRRVPVNMAGGDTQVEAVLQPLE